MLPQRILPRHVGQPKDAGSVFAPPPPISSLDLSAYSHRVVLVEQISTELSDLIGGDFDPSFVTWLFEEVKNHYPEPAAAAAAPTAPAPSIPTGPAAANQAKSSTSTAGLPPRPAGGRSMFGAAVTGVKRDSREMGADGSSREPPQQRQRFDARNGNSNGKSLFDRMGGNNAQFAPGPRNNTPLVNNLGMPQAAFDAVSTCPPPLWSCGNPRRGLTRSLSRRLERSRKRFKRSTLARTLLRSPRSRSPRSQPIPCHRRSHRKCWRRHKPTRWPKRKRSRRCKTCGTLPRARSEERDEEEPDRTRKLVSTLRRHRSTRQGSPHRNNNKEEDSDKVPRIASTKEHRTRERNRPSCCRRSPNSRRFANTASTARNLSAVSLTRVQSRQRRVGSC